MSIKKNATSIILPITIISIALLSASTIGAQESQDRAENDLTEKERKVYDKALKGRTAGKPQNCITRLQQKKMNLVSDDIFIFGSKNAKTIFVNKPAGGCAPAKHFALRYARNSTSLCSGDTAEVVDLVSGSTRGGCAFSKFIPFTKDDK